MKVTTVANTTYDMRQHSNTYCSDPLYHCEEEVWFLITLLMGFAGIATGNVNSHLIPLYQETFGAEL
jgi:hypothetical protein